MTFEPIGATPRMLVPVTTTSSSVVSVAGAALAVVGPDSWPNARAAVTDVATKSTILRLSFCMRKSPSDAGASECFLAVLYSISYLIYRIMRCNTEGCQPKRQGGMGVGISADGPAMGPVGGYSRVNFTRRS